MPNALLLLAALLSASLSQEVAGASSRNLPAPPAETALDAAMLARWPAPLRHWHYWPEHVIPANPVIGSITNLLGTDVPTVYQLPGDDKWYLSFVGFAGQGNRAFVAESTDLVHWGNYRLAMDYGPEGEFDHGGRVIGT